MSLKSISSVNQPESPLHLPPDDLPPKISTSKRLISPSLMFSYFNDSHCYLNQKYSENNAIFLNSNNFIRKDSLCPNNDEEEYSEENESEDEDNEYNQLNANGVYNQQYINHSNNSKLPLFRLTLNQQFNLMTQNQIKQQQRPRFNSGNFTMVPNTFNFLSPYQVEMYGKKGWVCTQCNNFNYDTRNKCNRSHAARGGKKNKKNSSNRQFSERVGDWVCFNCKNLNFSFRTVCNRCQLSKEESEDMVSKYQMNNNEDVNR